MNEVNKTSFIPLYGKSKVSKQNIILHDPDAERSSSGGQGCDPFVAVVL